MPSSDLRIPSFWLLEPYDCDGLTVSSGSIVTSGSSLVPELITLDSSGDPAEGDCGGSPVTPLEAQFAARELKVIGGASTQL